jgi:hypothetical protein
MKGTICFLALIPVAYAAAVSFGPVVSFITSPVVVLVVMAGAFGSFTKK